MRKIKYYTAPLLIVSVLFIGLYSCSKKCKIDAESVDSGAIRTDVLVFPVHGYITEDMSGDYHVNGNSYVADKFDMSTNGGQTKTPFNYSAYSILAYPMTVSCSFSLLRDVTFDDVNMVVTYKITVTECKDPKCTQERYVENFIAVPAIPSGYSIVRVIEEIKI